MVFEEIFCVIDISMVCPGFQWFFYSCHAFVCDYFHASIKSQLRNVLFIPLHFHTDVLKTSLIYIVSIASKCECLWFKIGVHGDFCGHLPWF